MKVPLVQKEKLTEIRKRFYSEHDSENYNNFHLKKNKKFISKYF